MPMASRRGKAAFLRRALGSADGRKGNSLDYSRLEQYDTICYCFAWKSKYAEAGCSGIRTRAQPARPGAWPPSFPS